MKKLLLGFGLCLMSLGMGTAWAQNPTMDCTQYPESEICIELQEPIFGQKVIHGSGADLVGNYIKLLYKYGASIIGIICVLIIVVSGVQIILGGADQSMFEDAKTRILQAILSMIILFLSAAILKTVNPGFFT